MSGFFLLGFLVGLVVMINAVKKCELDSGASLEHAKKVVRRYFCK